MSFLGVQPPPPERPPTARQQQVVMSPLWCVPCVAAAKMHDGPEETTPDVNLANLVVNGTSVCDGHFEVKRQSPLLVPGR